MKKLGLALAAVLAFGGCRREEQGTRIEFWTMQLADFREYIEGVIADFERQRPGVKVVWIDVPFDAMGQKLMTAYVAGRPPDVVNLNLDLASSLAPLGALVDVRDRGAPYLPAAWEALRFGEGIYAFPWYLSTEVTLYNSALLPEPPARFDLLPDCAPDAYVICPKIGSDPDLLKYFAMNGARGVRDGRVDFSDPACTETLLLWKRMLDAKKIPREALTESHRVAIRLYNEGKVAILLSGPQFLRIVRENNPAVYRATRVAPCLAGRADVTNIAVMCVAATTASPRRDDAVAFAEFLTNAANQLAFCKRVPILPSATAALEDPFFSREESIEDRARRIATRQLRTNGRVLATGLKRAKEVQKILQQVIQEVCFEGADPDKALRRAEETINRLVR